MKDKLRYMCVDVETGEKIYFDNLDAGVLAWLYLHYVTMDSVVLFKEWWPIINGYMIVLTTEPESELFDNLLSSMYELGVMLK